MDESQITIHVLAQSNLLATSCRLNLLLASLWCDSTISDAPVTAANVLITLGCRSSDFKYEAERQPWLR